MIYEVFLMKSKINWCLGPTERNIINTIYIYIYIYIYSNSIYMREKIHLIDYLTPTHFSNAINLPGGLILHSVSFTEKKTEKDLRKSLQR